MSLKEIIREKALELGFEDAGFTGVEPLDYYIREIDSRPQEMYGWVQTDRFNSYYTDGITPLEFREPMGTWVYGCDRCQEVCPRNQPWMNQNLPANGPLMQRAPDFDLQTLLTMDDRHYVDRVWPLAFYISRKFAAKWQMNAARALGNLGDPEKVLLLIQSLKENPNENVRAMCAWSLGRLGGKRAQAGLESCRSREMDLVREEIEQALQKN